MNYIFQGTGSIKQTLTLLWTPSNWVATVWGKHTARRDMPQRSPGNIKALCGPLMETEQVSQGRMKEETMEEWRFAGALAAV